MGPLKSLNAPLAALVLWAASLSFPWAQTVSTAAGGGAGPLGNGGPATLATLGGPDDVAVDPFSNLYIADPGHLVVWKVDAASGTITILAGTADTSGYSGDQGPASQATFNYPYGLALDSKNNLYIGDYYNNVVRKVASASGTLTSACTITTVAGNGSPGYSGNGGPATLASLWNPVGLAFDALDRLYIADYSNSVVRRVDLSTGLITAAAGKATPGYSGDNGPATLAAIRSIERVALDRAGNLYIADRDNFVIRKVAASTGIITTIAGTATPGYGGDSGPATQASVRGLDGMALDCSGSLLFADDMDGVVRRVDPATGIISTVAGSGVTGNLDGAALSARFGDIEGLAGDGQGNLYLSDYTSNNVRKITLLMTPCTPTPTSSPTLTPTISPTPSPTAPPCSGNLETYAYPDPAQGKALTVFCGLCEAGTVRIDLFNSAAQALASLSYAGTAGPNRFPVDIGGLAHGVYYFRVKVQGASGAQVSGTRKFAVVR